MYKAGLVLEGGGMRGVYTAGVLDFFIDKNLYFENVYGVSAGACHACSYLSSQRGRALRITTEYLKDKNYMGLYSLMKTGDLFGADMCYNIIPNKLDPYDYEAYNNYKGNFYAVVTNCETGKAEYLKIKDMKEDVQAIRASSSMPLVSRNVKINNKEYLDGGITDSIPLQKSIDDGNVKNVLVLTRQAGFIKAPSGFESVYKRKYKKYPEISEGMRTRHIKYNESLRLIENEKRAKRTFVIQPAKVPDISRTGRNKEKIILLYEEGYKDAQRCYNELYKFLNEV